MKNVLAVLIGIIMLFSVVTISGSKEKKLSKAEQAALAAAAWRDIKCDPAGLVDASYRMDGSIIVLRFRNPSKDRTVRVKYQATWKKNENGKWVDDGTQEGATLRLRKLEEVQKDIYTRSRGDIKDVAVNVVADEVS